MVEINIDPKQLYEGCIQAAITHAVAVGVYPELNYEHSWDGINYCMNDSQGCRATVTFHNKAWKKKDMYHYGLEIMSLC